MTQEVDRASLKIQALIQRVSQQAANYENMISEYLVNEALLQEEIRKRDERIEELEEGADVSKKKSKPE